MTAHPIDTEALRKQHAHLVEKYGPGAWAESRARVVLALLDALAAAEHRATRAEAQSAIRGRAVVIYRERARKAEARIKAWAQQYDYDMCLESDRADTAEARIKAVRELVADLEQRGADQIGWDTAALLPNIRRALDP